MHLATWLKSFRKRHVLKFRIPARSEESLSFNTEQERQRASPMLLPATVGLVLTVITVCIHAIGTAWWIGVLKRLTPSSNRYTRKVMPIRVLCLTALLLLLLHLVEVVPWAGLYLLLPDQVSLSTFEESAYFATVTYTSLGYGDVVIQGPWRILSAIQAMNGLLVFGWSTALLFAVVERIWGADTVPSTPQSESSQIVLSRSA